MRRLFNILLGALAMLAVALLSAFVTMRLAIHGREVKVPYTADSQERKRVLPVLFTSFPISYGDRCIAVIVARDLPIETQ